MATFWRKGHYRGDSWVEGHLVTREDFSKTSSGYNAFSNYSYALESHESFTIPNIKCKCCGDEIYFYQSPYGGKVFFNELGHPWEKHCCEPKCCAKTYANIHYEILDKDRIIELRKEPLWKREGWIPSISIREENCSNNLLRKIIFKSMEDYKEYAFFILMNNSSFLSDIEEGLAINFRPINETFFEISFYLYDIGHMIIASKYVNSNDLKEFTTITNYLKLIKKNNLRDMELAKIFFQILNISNNYKHEKKQICELIINHNNSKKSGMSQIYYHIYKHGIKSFEKDILNNFKSYSEIVIHILLHISIQKILSFKRIKEIILNKWREKGGKLYFYQKNEYCDSNVDKIILKSSEDNQDYSYYIQKKYIHSEIKENLPIFLSPLNEKIFEILFYDEMLKEHKVIIGKYPSDYELNIFIFLKTSLEFIKQNHIKNIQLAELFFKNLNISDDYKKEKKQLNDFIINHKISKETGMSDIYAYVNEFGIKQFEKNLLDKFYDDKVINILTSLNHISILNNIHAIILRYKNEEKEKHTVEQERTLKNNIDLHNQIYEIIINHNSSKKICISQVYHYIYKHGIKSFEEDILNNFESYSKVVIHILLHISTQKFSSFKRIQKIILNKCKENEKKLYFYQKNGYCDSNVNKIILKSSEDNQDYSYYVQKKYIHSKIKENLPIFLTSLNERFFEILFYDEIFEEHKVIIGKHPSNYELDTFILKKSLELVRQNNITNIQLAELFFKNLKISNHYKEKKRFNDFIINHRLSKETGMLDIYVYVNKFGIEEFEKNLLDKFEFYDDEVINILALLNHIPVLNNIYKTILKYKNEQKEKYNIDVNHPSNPQQKNAFESKKNKIDLKHNQEKILLEKNQKKVHIKNSNKINKNKVNFNYKKNQEQEKILQKKKDKSNLKPNRTKWKGITITKSKKIKLTFIKKGNN